MRIYLTEIRRSPLLWCFPLLVVVDLAAVFGRSQYWIGIWPQASAATQIPALFFAPVVGAAAAWTVGRSQRRGIAEFRSAAARPAWHMEAAQLVATLTYGLGAYTVGAVAAAAASMPEAGPGFLWPGYLLLGACVIVACGAIGHLIGRWSRSSYAAPVICGLGCFVLLGTLGGPHGMGFFFLSGPPDAALNPVAVIARLLLAFVLAALAIFAPDLPRRGISQWGVMRGRKIAGGVMGAVLIIVAVPVVGPVRVERTPPEEPLCSSGASRVCVWPEDRKYLPELSAMAGRLSTIPQDWIRVPGVFYERGLRPDPRLKPMDFDTSEGQLFFAAVTMATQTLHQSVDMTRRCDPRQSESAGKAANASEELWLWLQFRAVGTGDNAGVRISGPQEQVIAARNAVRSSETEQREWTRERLAVMNEATCG